MLQQTRLYYLEDFNLYSCHARVLETIKEDNKISIVFDTTVFYPQGGGQPYDQGYILGKQSRFKVNEVRFVDGIVYHIGVFEQGSFEIGEIVTCEVDQARRTLHTRLHSGGHVVDMAVNALKYPWRPGKGFHFPEGPYVEYTASLVEADKEHIKADIERVCNQFIQQETRATRLCFMSKQEMGSVCRFVPDYIPENKPGRVVMYGDFGVPCGGTHVHKLADIGTMTIRKIKVSGDTVRVSYDIGQNTYGK